MIHLHATPFHAPPRAGTSIRAHFLGMVLTVKKDISLDPIHIGLFRADGLMPFPEDFPNLIQELHLLSSSAEF
jgi:hypothetical protein